MSSQSEAGHGYFAFSEFCVAGEFKKIGLRDGEFTLNSFEVFVECACLNVQTGKVDAQPGVGNAGDIAALIESIQVMVDKEKGVVELSGCSDVLDVYNNHDCTDPGCDHANPPPAGFHVCHARSVHKKEIDDSCVFTSFETTWSITDQNGKEKFKGTDTCTWNGGRNEDGTLNTIGANCQECAAIPPPDPLPAKCNPNGDPPGICTFSCVSVEGKK
jgi:hypothetical protein